MMIREFKDYRKNPALEYWHDCVEHICNDMRISPSARLLMDIQMYCTSEANVVRSIEKKCAARRNSPDVFIWL